MDAHIVALQQLTLGNEEGHSFHEDHIEIADCILSTLVGVEDDLSAIEGLMAQEENNNSRYELCASSPYVCVY